MEQIIYDQDRHQILNYHKLNNKYILQQPNLSFNFTKFQNNLQKKQSLLIPKRQIPFLKKILKKNKINHLVDSFCKKIKQNNIYRQPVDYQLQINSQYGCLQKIIGSIQGYQITGISLTILNMINILLMFALTLFYTIIFIFPQVNSNLYLQKIQILGLSFYFLEMVLNFCTKTYIDGKALVKIKQISFNYLRKRFSIDFLSLVALMFNISTNSNPSQLFRIFVFFKIPQSIQKLSTLQNIYITNTHREQYWGLINVLLTNFAFAHILALILNSMVYMDEDNWLIKHNLINNPWWQKYIWGYYWGVTTMLTVGFGDFVASNYKQALCMIFIQVISCMTLSYNINYVGNLINNIRQQSIQKNKSLKIFHQIINKNKINSELQNRINNYIQQSYKIKKKFNFAQQDQLLQFLPLSLRSEFISQIHSKSFKNLPFLKNLTPKIQQKLAQKINRLITHPDQVIQKKNQQQKLIFLKSGEIGFTYKNALNNQLIVQRFKIQNINQSKLISLGFLFNKKLEYEIKSLSYSILYYLQKQELIQVLKNSSYDFENFCMLKDKSKHFRFQYELYKCQLCPKQFHNKFSCSKLHYIPIQQHVVYKYLKNIKNNIQQRQFFKRQFKTKFRSLKNNFYIIQDLQKIKGQMCQLNSIDSSRQNQLLVGNSSKSIVSKQEQIVQQLNTKELIYSIKGHQLNHFRSNQFQNSIIGENLFRNIQCDGLYNWRYYFPLCNSSQLGKKMILKSGKIK